MRPRHSVSSSGLLMAGSQQIGWSAIRKNWTPLAQGVAAVMTVVATVITPPPTAAGTHGIRPFASFVVAVLIGMFMLAITRFRKREHAGLWVVFGAVLLALTIGNYFWYVNLTDSLTLDWRQHMIVIGTEVQPEVQKAYGSTIAKPMAAKLMDDATGQPELIWTHRSIALSRNLLCISYLLMAPLIGGCILAASQVTICVTRPASHRSAKRGRKKQQSQT